MIEYGEDGEARAVIAPGHGEPVLDDDPVLRAVDRLVKIDERLAKLAGADAPTEANLNAAPTVQRPAELDNLIQQARERQEAAEWELVADE
ncbi:hypothetical protein [Amycolatopsis sp. cmx-8-4]|uniref:hypothetical protein n=1 Tax=Amycolatopsis sp. cmx-8-4 TaxID=2790947 RepID=UPI00397E0727